MDDRVPFAITIANGSGRILERQNSLADMGSIVLSRWCCNFVYGSQVLASGARFHEGGNVPLPRESSTQRLCFVCFPGNRYCGYGTSNPLVRLVLTDVSLAAEPVSHNTFICIRVKLVWVGILECVWPKMDHNLKYRTDHNLKYWTDHNWKYCYCYTHQCLARWIMARIFSEIPTATQGRAAVFNNVFVPILRDRLESNAKLATLGMEYVTNLE